MFASQATRAMVELAIWRQSVRETRNAVIIRIAVITCVFVTPVMSAICMICKLEYFTKKIGLIFEILAAFWRALVEEPTVPKMLYANWSRFRKFPTATVQKAMKVMELGLVLILNLLAISGTTVGYMLLVFQLRGNFFNDVLFLKSRKRDTSWSFLNF